MIRRTTLLLLALLIAVGAGAEVYFVAISATDTSSTTYLPKPSASVLACNDGANTVYLRVFDENDYQSGKVAAATTSSQPLAAGVCRTYTKPETGAAYYKAISAICAAGLTTTVNVYAE